MNLPVNEIMGAAVYLVLGLSVAVGLIAVFKRPSSKRKPNSAPIIITTSAPLTCPEMAAKSQRDSLTKKHALPWAIPPAFTPEETNGKSQKAAITLEEIARRLDAIEALLNRIRPPEIADATVSVTSDRQ